MGNPITLQQNGKLSFTIPDFEIGEIQAEATRVDYKSATDYTWSAKITNKNGYMSIIGSPVGIFGFIQLNNFVYEIMPIRGNIEVIVKKNNEISDVDNCSPFFADENNEENIDWCIEPSNNCASTIDILVLIPPDATTWFQNKLGDPLWLNWYVSLGIEGINIAFNNSGINNKQVRYSAAFVDFPYSNPLNCNDVVQLATFAAPLRQQYKADLVVLLTGKDYPCGAGVANGTAASSSNSAFAIVELNWMIHPRWTFAHEVGHLMAARHSRTVPGPGDDNTDVCGHGWTIGENRFQRTLMAPWFGTQTPTDVRVLHYSNPSIKYNGDDTGTSENDNAKTIRNSACVIDDYFPSQQFDFWIEAPNEVCFNDGSPTLDASVQVPSAPPGLPPYTFCWTYNQSGIFDFFNPGTPIGCNQSQIFNLPSGLDYVFVHLTVISVEGLFFTKTKKIIINHDCFQGGGDDRDNIIKTKANGNEFTVFPNPTDNNFILSVMSEVDKSSLVIITNLLGQIVHQ
jgi:hypothetical protein